MTTIIALVALVLVIGVCSRSAKSPAPRSGDGCVTVELASYQVPYFDPRVVTPAALGPMPYTDSVVVTRNTSGQNEVTITGTINTVGYSKLTVGFYVFDETGRPIISYGTPGSKAIELKPTLAYGQLPPSVYIQSTLGVPQWTRASHRVHLVIFDEKGNKLYSVSQSIPTR